MNCPGWQDLRLALQLRLEITLLLWQPNAEHLLCGYRFWLQIDLRLRMRVTKDLLRIARLRKIWGHNPQIELRPRMQAAKGLLRIARLQNIWGHNPQIDLRLRMRVAKGLLRIARLQNIWGGSRSGWLYVHGSKWVYGYNCTLHCGHGSGSARIGSTVTAANCDAGTDANH